MTTTKNNERRLSAPMVLVAASAMISVGVVALLSSGALDEPDARGGVEQEAMADVVRVAVDRASPSATAESFLDAWRKRDYATARELSIEGAERVVLLRMARESNLSADERELKRQVWDAMAAHRLLLEVDEERPMEGGGVHLSGVARGEFLGAPYARRIGFEVVEREGGYVVRLMTLGDVLSETPEFLEMPPRPGAP